MNLYAGDTRFYFPTDAVEKAIRNIDAIMKDINTWIEAKIK